MEANHEILSTLTSYSLINSETIQSYSLLFKDEFITQEANKHFEQFDSYSKQTKKLLLQLKSKHHKNGLLFGFDNDLLSAVGFLNQKTDLKLPEEDIEGEKEEKEEKQKEKEKQKQKEKQKEKEKEKEQKAEIVFKTFCLSTKLFDIKNPLKYSTLFHRSHFLPKLPLIEKYFESIKEIQQGKKQKDKEKEKIHLPSSQKKFGLKKGSKNNKILKFKNHPIINTKDNSYNLQFQFFLAFFSNQSENSDKKQILIL
ncbi:hypothetical protein M0813_07229 [Anaeramoeba flamelloides]|uniref:Uncharacterized protein n=1 Tax=Anaeramoeba flamelloides TaxID=1746091 RepID=A0ABQ8XBF0_9EUKA|nr:hypothetical protein M0813_07229 [Anaeramoeba flamelloides]